MPEEPGAERRGAPGRGLLVREECRRSRQGKNLVGHCPWHETPAEADRIFGALSDGGKINMPIQETFWAHRFGMLVDRYGTPWMVNCEKPMN